jgi:hypothetical protein
MLVQVRGKGQRLRFPGRFEGRTAGAGQADHQLSLVARMSGPADQAGNLQPGQDLAHSLAFGVHGRRQLFLVQGPGRQPFECYDRRTRQSKWRKRVVLAALDQPRGPGQQPATFPEIAL